MEPSFQVLLSAQQTTTYASVGWYYIFTFIIFFFSNFYFSYSASFANIQATI